MRIWGYFGTCCVCLAKSRSPLYHYSHDFVYALHICPLVQVLPVEAFVSWKFWSRLWVGHAGDESVSQGGVAGDSLLPRWVVGLWHGCSVELLRSYVFQRTAIPWECWLLTVLIAPNNNCSKYVWIFKAFAASELGSSPKLNANEVKLSPIPKSFLNSNKQRTQLCFFNIV